MGVAGRAEFYALSSQSPNHGSVPSPEPLSLHVHPFSLAKQTGGELRQTHGQRTLFWVVDFLYINKENQNTSKDDFPCLLLPSVSP